jgi:hypothetical protein
MELQLVAIFLGGLGACGDATLPTPKLGSHSGDELIVVPYPPPPARVEIIPARPADKRSVWIDGEWVFQAQRWTWQAGRWVVPDPRAYYAPPTTVRLSDGTLVWFAGTWHAPRAAGGK